MGIGEGKIESKKVIEMDDFIDKTNLNFHNPDLRHFPGFCEVWKIPMIMIEFSDWI